MKSTKKVLSLKILIGMTSLVFFIFIFQLSFIIYHFIFSNDIQPVIESNCMLYKDSISYSRSTASITERCADLNTQPGFSEKTDKKRTISAFSGNINIHEYSVETYLAQLSDETKSENFRKLLFSRRREIFPTRAIVLIYKHDILMDSPLTIDEYLKRIMINSSSISHICILENHSKKSTDGAVYETLAVEENCK
jgi:hypothetical protein